MVYKLKPIELSFDFEDRSYRLGDSVDVELTLVPSGDLDVREARVDLILEERFMHRYENVAPANLRGGVRAIDRRSQITRRASEVRKETSVHSSVVFLNETRLASGVPSKHKATLQIETVPPQHAEEAAALQRDASQSWSFKWRLVASVDIVRGRNPKKQRALKVTLPVSDPKSAAKTPTDRYQWREGKRRRQ